MFFVTDLPDENVTVEQVSGPIEIPIGANTPRTAIVEVTIRIPEGDLGDRFTMGWGITGCARPCEYFWTWEGQEE